MANSMYFAMLFQLACALIFPVAAVTPEELESFFYSSSGFDMSRKDAHSLAEQEAPILSQCRVTVSDLKTLKAVLYDPSTFDFSRADLTKQLLPLAKQHLDPDQLKVMFKTLYDTSTIDFFKRDASPFSIQLVKSHAEASQLTELYKVLRNLPGLSLNKQKAQDETVALGEAGCDPVALQKSFAASKNLDSAKASAVRANLNGESKRYAADGKAYAVSDFQQYYGEKYLSEWLKSPFEKRVANDGKAYTASEFRIYYSSTWEQKWHEAKDATQMRIAEDGKIYSLADFVNYYHTGGDWREKWNAAPEVPCSECSAKTTAERELHV
eukprot:TRINITY_DN4273_c0_g2_i2.p1 TRINITY_DN4273_c0_g2~~TRINITY_DN4273_c0_g2_i2.p1  ORF type:complete len:325 (+),score=62.55 TRINITY_DN4273_c0_g2_i2:103-1077(+)